MKRTSFVLAMACVLALFALGGCSESQSQQNDAKLDPNNPVSLTVWHYYNGAQQAAFDDLVAEFNSTVGQEKGIYVEGSSQGSVSDLEQAITDSAAGVVGSKPLPDVFSSYGDTAYALEQEDLLADLSGYFTEDELKEYVPSYIEEGYFNHDGKLYLFPVAKSTEITMVNTTDWEPFAQATGATLDDLRTFEGITKVAEEYYEWTDAQTPDVPDDGKALYGRDSMSNYFIIGMKQQGIDLFDVDVHGNVTINCDKDAIRRLWDNYYVPYVSGWFNSLGKFRSDDVKTGDILAYTGSSSSASYFPDQVIGDEESYPIGYAILPAPVFEGGNVIHVQQGAGMCVTTSDATHEYAACEFLKWFTEKENSLTFACASSYLPVRNDANTVEALDDVIAVGNLSISSKAFDCLKEVMENYDFDKFYTPSCFANGYVTRRVLDYNLSDKAQADREAIDEQVAQGASRAEALEPYVSDEAFDAWYEDFCAQLEAKAHPQSDE